MRIGIYTLPLRYNYGGLLQNWALQTVLKRMGHDVVTLAPILYLRLSWCRKPFSYAKRIVKKMLGMPSILHYEAKVNAEHDLLMCNLQPFIDTNIKRKEYWEVSSLKAEDYDVLIAGSDQVWRPGYNRTYRRTIENAFFDFARKWKVKRIAYAVSFGTDEWELTERETKRCARLARKFSSVSVREKSGIALCKEHLGVDAIQALDPTLLLDRSDYEELIEKGQPTHAPTGNLMCCILDETAETSALVARIANDKKLIPFQANSRVEDKTAPIEERIQPPVEQWLRNFREAEFVVTDSFHACVFSIIFGKPFIVIGNKARGMSRYESLLTMLGLESHLIYTASEYDPTFSYAGDQSAIEKLSALKATSLSFLKASLKP